MTVSIDGVDPELTKLTTYEGVMAYLQEKSEIDRVNPVHFDIDNLKKWLHHFHNKYREYHNAPPLTTNGPINYSAQKWADEMAHKKQSMVHEQPAPYGENLSYFAANYFPSPKNAAAAIVHGFYTEGTGYNYSRFDPQSWSKVGHFTQLIWHSSRVLGVGATIVKRNSKRHIYVCLKYDPPGNLQTAEAYKTNVKPAESSRGCCSIQ
uniref:SCP domain-containing protein n=1 Tax=Caenorhabditis tropicalis TaxID=1561998 RepID=A0A1I7U0Q5_9PELO